MTLQVPPATLEAIAALVEARVLEHLTKLDVATGIPEWLSVESAARYLDVSPERVRKLIARRAIPHYQDGPACRIFLRRRELDEWMSTSRVGTVAPSHGSRTAVGDL